MHSSVRAVLYSVPKSRTWSVYHVMLALIESLLRSNAHYPFKRHFIEHLVIEMATAPEERLEKADLASEWV